MKSKKVIESLVPCKNVSLLLKKVDGQRRYYENGDTHLGVLSSSGTLIELVHGSEGVRIYKNGVQSELNYALGIGYPVETFSFFETTYRIDTTGKFVFLTPIGKNQECAYWLHTLEMELQPDMYGADATMAGGIIIE